MIDAGMPTGRAVARILTTGSWMTGHGVVLFLSKEGYITTPSKVRGALGRLWRRGLVEKQHLLDRYGSNEWRVTVTGIEFAAEPWPRPKQSRTRRSKGSGGTRTSSKGSSGRTGSMCIDPSKPSFTKAVTDVVAEFVAKKQTFSAYDVTKALREKVNTGTFTIDPQETGTVHVGGKGVPRIDHEEVKGVVTECFHASEMPGYDRDHNGQYFEYKPTTLPLDPAPVAPDPATPPTSSTPYDGTPTL